MLMLGMGRHDELGSHNKGDHRGLYYVITEVISVKTFVLPLQCDTVIVSFLNMSLCTE
jgi:hypothetical protein